MVHGLPNVLAVILPSDPEQTNEIFHVKDNVRI